MVNTCQPHRVHIVAQYKSNIYCARKQQPANVSVGWLSAKNYSRENYQFYSILFNLFDLFVWYIHILLFTFVFPNFLSRNCKPFLWQGLIFMSSYFCLVGLWYYLHGQSLPSLTLIGSPNFGETIFLLKKKCLFAPETRYRAKTEEQ